MDVCMILWCGYVWCIICLDIDDKQVGEVGSVKALHEHRDGKKGRIDSEDHLSFDDEQSTFSDNELQGLMKLIQTEKKKIVQHNSVPAFAADEQETDSDKSANI